MATARDASINRRPRKSNTTEQPISRPAPTGPTATVHEVPAGMPTTSSMMLPYDIPTRPHHKQSGGTPCK